MSLPGYDDWKTHDPADDRCEFCGADPRYEGRGGWQPERCNGECGRRFRDPDEALDEAREREREPEPPAGWDD